VKKQYQQFKDNPPQQRGYGGGGYGQGDRQGYGSYGAGYGAGYGMQTPGFSSAQSPTTQAPPGTPGAPGAGSPTTDYGADPYAAYGGYANYVAWYSYYAAQQQQQGAPGSAPPGPPSEQPPPPPPSGSPPAQNGGYNAVSVGQTVYIHLRYKTNNTQVPPPPGM
jgi:hypothetical protein